MKHSNPRHHPTRRDFLKGVAATGGAAALVAANATPLVDPGRPLTPAPRDGTRKQGYRLTPHIRDYYRSLR